MLRFLHTIKSYRVFIFAVGIVATIAFLSVSGCVDVKQPVHAKDHPCLAEQQVNKRIPLIPTKPLTLDAAIAFALKHNIDAAIARQEQMVKNEAISGAMRKLLPSMMMNLDSSDRTHPDASKSKDLNSGRLSGEPSISEQSHKFTFNTRLAWNLLDFGIGYFRARQAKQEARIQALRLQRLKQKLVLQVTEAWWQLQLFRRACAIARKCAKELKEQERLIKKQVEDETLAVKDAMQQQATILEARVWLQQFDKNRYASRGTLLTLLGLPASAKVKIVDESFEQAPLPLHEKLEKLDLEALRQRPETREKDFQELVARDEERIALAALFPNASVFGRMDYDQNRFLHWHQWYTAGLSAALDLLSFPQKQSRRHTTRIQTDIVRKQRLSLALAIVAQVHLAWFNYRELREELGMTRELSNKYQDIVKELRSGVKEGVTRPDEVFYAKLKAIRYQMRVYQVFTDTMIARQRLFNTLGRSAVTRSTGHEPIKTNTVAQKHIKSEQTPHEPAVAWVSANDVKTTPPPPPPLPRQHPLPVVQKNVAVADNAPESVPAPIRAEEF